MNTKNKVKACQDCKYYFSAHPIDPSPHRCNNPAFCNIDVITGKLKSIDARLCRMDRTGKSMCGHKAVGFAQKEVDEPKKSWYSRVFG